MAQISIAGAGYVGLVTGACLAQLGHDVTCLEIEPTRLAELRRGVLPIYEPGLEALFARQTAAGRLRITDDYAAAIPSSQFAFIAVNTPACASGAADTRFVLAAARAIFEHASPGLTLVLKSTVPVGTGDAIAQLAAELNRSDIRVISNPEFLREGSAIQDFVSPDRIVIGAEPREAGEAVAALYTLLNAPVVLCGRRSAELAKYAANALLATRISFINEIAALCEAGGADVMEVAEVVGADRRIGPAFLRAGLGWGGSCFPKDVRALAATAEQFGVPSSIVDAVFDVNARQRERAFRQVRAAVDGVDHPRVGVLGLAFKPGTDDIREAPALDIIGRLLEEGIHVQAHDPVAMTAVRRVLPNIRLCADPYEAVRGSDAVILAAEWPEYLDLDWERVSSFMRGRVVLDGRNALDRSALAAAGLTHHAMGRPHPAPAPSRASLPLASVVADGGGV
jgi:UDPglucose 6-dehydrogenase